ncbi:hypothetical protein, partial [Nostoc flagelliforme]|uniref:hypothetical protein n=1 Tax=Nostoc flagelliforme TaxID=1306274 RepID=UPI001A7E49CF
DSTTGEISENSLSCIQHQCIQGITLTLPDFGLNRTVLMPPEDRECLLCLPVPVHSQGHDSYRSDPAMIPFY